jgi:hypothetical protein
VAAFAVAGCQRGSAVGDTHAFVNAPPETKALWQNALAASKTNGYVAAFTGLQSLREATGTDAAQNRPQNVGQGLKASGFNSALGLLVMLAYSAGGDVVVTELEAGVGIEQIARLRHCHSVQSQLPH